MARVQANSAENYESVMITLSKNNYPIAYKEKIDELVEQGCYETIKDAERENPTIEIELEFYYDKHCGLFAVESEAISSCAESICSPYTGEYMLDFVEE